MEDIIMVYPYFNTLFYIHTDTIDFKLGLVISQSYILIVFHGRNLTGNKMRYTVTKMTTYNSKNSKMIYNNYPSKSDFNISES